MAASRNPRVRLLHIRDEIDSASAAVRGVDFNAYRDNYMLRRAIERALQIISEAPRALPSDLLAQHPDAPWDAIIGIGNVLRHDYHAIDAKRLWEIATGDLPKLRPVILKMLDEFGA